MHEQGIIDNLIRKIVALAEQAEASKVEKVCIKLGALSQMSPEHFKEHYDISAKGTIAEHAALDIEISEDLTDPDAQAILLKSLDIS